MSILHSIRIMAGFATVLAFCGACKAYVYPPELETQGKIDDLTGRLEQFHLRARCLPRSLGDWIVDDSTIHAKAKDAWGRQLELRAKGSFVAIVSAGADGVLDSEDDIFGTAVAGEVCGAPELRQEEDSVR